MVNLGASRGCITCKQRRKKCDGTRPICKRCTTAKRQCLGYAENSDFLFRHYQVPSTSNTASVDTTPKAISSLAGAPLQSVSFNLRDEGDFVIESLALDIFFREFCVLSTDRHISRGFLHSFQDLIAQQDKSLDMTQAAKAVGLAAVGNRLQRRSLIRTSEQWYSAVLYSFQRTITGSGTACTQQSLATAALLGIYEIVRSSEEGFENHVAHVHGVCSILSLAESPFKIEGGTDLFQLHNPLQLPERPQPSLGTTSVLHAPVCHPFVHSLDSILSEFNPIYQLSRDCLSDSPTSADIESLLHRAQAVEREFATWHQQQAAEWRPQYFDPSDTSNFHDIGNVPGPWHTYFDLYVAAVWNTYRKTHLMVLDIIAKCKRKAAMLSGGETATPMQEENDINTLAEQIATSIPFHLDQTFHIREPWPTDHSPFASSGGGGAAGLLLLHPLWVLVTIDSVPGHIRLLARKTLVWIQKNIGIGQAGLLGDPTVTIPFYRVALGHTLIWAGMLI